MFPLIIAELINNHLSSRLPSVPEESTDDAMFGRNDVYDFPSIMGKCSQRLKGVNLHYNSLLFLSHI